VIFYLFELLVGLAMVLALSAIMWYAGAYILMAAFVAAVLYAIRELGSVVVATWRNKP
jgi:hypothetical protein